MKRLSLALGALALAFAATAVHADTFSFSFSPVVPGLFDFAGSGTFTATEVGNTDIYNITAVTGTVTDILGPSTITGLLGLNSFQGNDNELIYPGSGLFGEKFFDSDGVSFSLKNGNDVNLHDNGVEWAVGGSPKGSDSFELDIVDVSTDPSTPAVPEPSTLALFGTGILGAAGAIRRRLMA
jgi:hypothetical protein